VRVPPLLGYQLELTSSGLQYNNDLFNFTRGRFVPNEQYELSQRHVHFAVDELARIAAESVGAKSCVNIEKYPDGMYNRAMLLTMNDGNQVVVKVPIRTHAVHISQLRARLKHPNSCVYTASDAQDTR